jgi:ABC-2 type transport system ATP-binding protein
MAITLDSVTKVFPGSEALHQVSFSIPPAQIFGLLGPNGAGKTTAIQIIIGLLGPTLGHVRVFGLDPAQNALQIRALTGLVMQQTALDAYLTGREHLELMASLYRLGRVERRRRISDLLTWSGLAEAADRLTLTYSGGMKRRLDLAISLLHRPRILILDEPTLGLDIQTRRQLWSLIRELKQAGTTIVLTTHYLEEADQLCDRIGILRAGHLLAVGTPSELKERIGTHLHHLVVRLNGEADELLSYQPHRLEAGVAVWLGRPEQLSALLTAIVAHHASKVLEANITQPSLDEVFMQILTDGAIRPAQSQPAAAHGQGGVQ